MKKAYTKPGIYVEDFRISQSFALSCGVNSETSTIGKPTQADSHVCGWDMGNIIIWSKNTVCNDLEDPEVPLEGHCYNNPNGGASIFAS